MENKMKTRPDLLFVSLLSLLSTLPAGITGSTERHSLTYIYTAFSKPALLPGIHEFTAMGLVDDTMIDYFDSDLKKKIPKQPWMVEQMDKGYWEKGTQSRLSKQTWFRVNIDILIKRMRQNDTDTHILQWRHGCESVTKDGTVRFFEGKDTYNYDGQDFLHFDDKDGVWISTSPAAEDTKRKWDGVQTLKDYTKGYLEKECLDWLTKFVEFGRKQHQAAPPPDMFMFAKKSHSESNVVLTCLASGFPQKDAVLEMRRNGYLLNEVDGVSSSGVRPNNDDTYQSRHCVEILKTDESEYTCEVLHKGSGLRVKTTWDHKLPADGSGYMIWIGLAVILLTIGIAVLATVLLLRKKGKCGGSNGSNKSSSNGSLMEASIKAEPDPHMPPAAESALLNPKKQDSDSGSSRSDSGVSAVSTISGVSSESKNPSESAELLDQTDRQ